MPPRLPRLGRKSRGGPSRAMQPREAASALSPPPLATGLADRPAAGTLELASDLDEPAPAGGTGRSGGGFLGLGPAIGGSRGGCFHGVHLVRGAPSVCRFAAR